MSGFDISAAQLVEDMASVQSADKTRGMVQAHLQAQGFVLSHDLVCGFSLTEAILLLYVRFKIATGCSFGAFEGEGLEL